MLLFLEKEESLIMQRIEFCERCLSFYARLSPDIIFGFNKMPGLDLYFAADTCFAKQALKKI